MRSRVNPFTHDLNMYNIEELKLYRSEHAISMPTRDMENINKVIAAKEEAQLNVVARAINAVTDDDPETCRNIAKVAIDAILHSSREEPTVKNMTEQFGECGRYRISSGEFAGMWTCDKCHARWSEEFHSSVCPYDNSEAAKQARDAAQARAIATYFPDHIEKK